MTTERIETTTPETERRVGRVIAVCSKAEPSYPKFQREKVDICPFGIVGDAHAGPWRESYSKPGKLVPNDRAISIVADEVKQELTQKFGIEIAPGDFNENILVTGLGDLSDLRPGDEMRFSGGVVLKVTAQNTPCRKLEEYLGGKGVIKALTEKTKQGIKNKRGIVADVLRFGDLEPGELVEVIKVKS